MEDQDVLDHIEKLVEEEQDLRDRIDEGLSDSERERMDKLQVDLDRYWDLLRRRRSLRQYGKDPDVADPRTEETVEEYEQ